MLCKEGFYPRRGRCVRSNVLNCRSTNDNRNCNLCEGLLVGNRCTGRRCSTSQCRSCKLENGFEICQNCFTGYTVDLFTETCERNNFSSVGCLKKDDNICVACYYGYYDSSNSYKSDCYFTSILNQVLQIQNNNFIIDQLNDFYDVISRPIRQYW